MAQPNRSLKRFLTSAPKPAGALASSAASSLITPPTGAAPFFEDFFFDAPRCDGWDPPTPRCDGWTPLVPPAATVERFEGDATPPRCERCDCAAADAPRCDGAAPRCDGAPRLDGAAPPTGLLAGIDSLGFATGTAIA